MSNAAPAPGKASELKLRIMSGLVLAALVLGATWAGGGWFRALWVAAAGIALHEWLTISATPRGNALKVAIWLAFATISALVLFPSAALALGWSDDLAAFGLLAIAAAAIGLWEYFSEQRLWATSGLVYATAPAIAFTYLRDGARGLIVILFLFAVVWATDIFAYFVGRTLKGPKLAPRISPGKTWSGSIGGTIFAVVASGLLAASIHGLWAIAIALPALVLSVLSQAGDLGESAFKRHFGVKDSGHIIPGHGGVMDRVDALVIAALALYLMARLNGGLPPGFAP